MTLITGQAPVPGSSTVPLFVIPPSSSDVTVFLHGTSASVYVGLSTALTTANGMQVTTSPVEFSGTTWSKGATLYGTTGSATASTLNYIISTGGLA